MVSFIAAAGPCRTYTIYSLFTEDHPNFSTAMRTTFRDRMEAGQLLAEQLCEYERRADAIVLALPRGGVPVAYEIATKLGLPLDVFVVRKLGVPGHEEFAMGAIASGGVIVLNRETIEGLRLPKEALERVIGAERTELARREQ